MRHPSAAQTTLTAGLLGTTIAATGTVAAQDIVESELEDLRTRVGQLEAATVGTATGVRLTFGGYVKADFIYDFDQSLGDTFFVDSIVVDGGDGESRFTAHARQTRFNIRTESDTPRGPLTTFIEADFFGPRGNEIFSNSHSLRLRHAVVEWDNWTIGQFWTNFMPIDVYPTTVDFEGPAGIPFVRQVQLRYTWPLGDRLALSASLENSEFSGRDADETFSESTSSGIRAGLDEIPDFTIAAAYTADWGMVRAAGVARRLGSPVSDDTEFGWGVNLAGQLDLWRGGSVVGSFTGGEGVGRYIINGGGQDAFVAADGSLEPITSWGATVGLTHDFTPQITGGLTGGYYKVEDTFADTATKELQTVHASLFWRPVERLAVGAEVMHGRRETADGSSDNATRLQASVQVNF